MVDGFGSKRAFGLNPFLYHCGCFLRLMLIKGLLKVVMSFQFPLNCLL